MSWDHRVMRHREGDAVWYAVHEVYYDEAGRPTACTENPVEPFGETFEELRDDLHLFAKALEKPVLDYDDICLTEKGL